MAIFPLLLSPPLEEPPPSRVPEPDVEVADADSLAELVRLNDDVTVSKTVLVGGPAGVDVLCGNDDELLEGVLDVLELVGGGDDDVLLVEVVVGGGGGVELVVEVVVGGGAGVDVVDVEVVVWGAVGAVGDVVSAAPPGELVVLDMVKDWRLSRG